MGSDSSPILLFQAVLQAAEQLDPSCSFVVIATKSVADELITVYQQLKQISFTKRIIFRTAPDFIKPNEDPLSAVRLKKTSSLLIGIRLLKKNQIDAFVTAGNTGALIASATLSLPMLEGILRPALLAELPTKRGSVAVVDVGGNVSCKAHHLVQFAHLGAAYQRCRLDVQSPRVGLLNIGVESKKGTSEIRQAYQLLSGYAQHVGENPFTPINFVGNIEARDVFEGKVDVLVTDGFTGNVLLKSTEGAASFIFDYLQENCRKESQLVLKKTLTDLQPHFSYDEYSGAILCGIDRVIVKCHGHATTKAMFNSIKGAFQLVSKKFISQIKSQLK